MSGITPILDTLLHQVLGRRADTPVARDLNRPVSATEAGQGPQAVHSDSRLDARSAAAGLAQYRLQHRGGLQPLPGAAPDQRSSETRLSVPARAIAEMLTRYPAPPGVIRPGRPLAPGDGETTPASLAGNLRASIEDSGIFYEAHLARWYRGALVRAQLEREPQMNLSRPAGSPGPEAPLSDAQVRFRRATDQSIRELPSVSGRQHAPTGDLARANVYSRHSPAGDPRHEGSGAFLSGNLRAPGNTTGEQDTVRREPLSYSTSTRPVADGSRVDSGVAWKSAASTDFPAVAVQTGLPPGSEELQGIVRQQLEILATPVLRWEGDIWSGLFLALIIHFPDRGDKHPGGGPDREEQESQDKDPRQWRTEMRVSTATLGEIRLALELGGDRLDISLAGDGHAMPALAAGREQLQRRLGDCGFQEVNIRLEPEVENHGR